MGRPKKKKEDTPLSETKRIVHLIGKGVQDASEMTDKRKQAEKLREMIVATESLWQNLRYESRELGG